MNDTVAGILTIYVVGMAVQFAFGVVELADARQKRLVPHDEEVTAARLMLSSPVWPFVVLFVASRGLRWLIVTAVDR